MSHNRSSFKIWIPDRHVGLVSSQQGRQRYRSCLSSVRWHCELRFGRTKCRTESWSERAIYLRICDCRVGRVGIESELGELHRLRTRHRSIGEGGGFNTHQVEKISLGARAAFQPGRLIRLLLPVNGLVKTQGLLGLLRLEVGRVFGGLRLGLCSLSGGACSKQSPDDATAR